MLRERGDIAGALSVAERGLELRLDAAGAPRQELERARLAAWLVDLAAGQGRVDLALRAGADALPVEPELGLYRRLGELAGAGWPALREQLLVALRASKSWRVSGRLDIFLHEGLIDDAIVALGTHPLGTDLARVMDAAIATRPDWVISRATASAEGIMNAGDAKHYDSAIEWLRRARAAYQVAGRTAEWVTYLQQLHTKHARKHKLIALLDTLDRLGR